MQSSSLGGSTDLEVQIIEVPDLGYTVQLHVKM